MDTNLIQSVGIFAAILVAYVLFQTLTMRRMKKMEGKTIEQDSPVPGMSESGKKLVYFYTPTCHACKSMTPVIDSMIQKRTDVHKVDASQNFAAARTFSIMATPTVLLIDEMKVVKVLVGPQKEKDLLTLLD